MLLLYEFPVIEGLIGKVSDLPVGKCAFFRLNQTAEIITAFALERQDNKNLSSFCNEIFGKIKGEEKPSLIDVLNQYSAHTASITNYNVSGFGFKETKELTKYEDRFSALKLSLAEAEEDGKRPRGTFIFSDLGVNYNEINSNPNHINEIVKDLSLGDIVFIIGNPLNPAYSSSRVPVLAVRKTFICLGSDIYIRNFNSLVAVGDIAAQEFNCEQEYIRSCGLESYLKIN